MSNYIGTLLRRARTRAALSQRELARRAGTAQSVVARIERGHSSPTWTTLQRLLGAAGCELRAVLGERATVSDAAHDRVTDPVMTDFATLLAALDDRDVSFIIVGGLAATIHGSGRLTQDVGIAYERSDENIERLVRALAPHNPYLRGAPPGLPFEWSAKTIRRGLNFTLTTAVGDIDILGEIVGGGSYDDLLSHTTTVELFARTHRCLDLPRLIHVNRAAGRPKDLEVIAELEALREERDDT